MSTAEIVDGTAEGVDDGPTGAALALVPSNGGRSVIRAERPEEVIEKATAIADVLKNLIEDKGLSTNVGGNRKHVNVDGWQALGMMLGALGGEALHAETVWSRRVLDETGAMKRTQYQQHIKRYFRGGGGIREEVTFDVDGYDWEACVEVRTAAGVVMGRAEAMCSREEETWSKRDEYAVRSMAETRAESRAYRRAVGWIVNIAGYSPTPSEEMPPQSVEPELPPWARPASREQVEAFKSAWDVLATMAGVDAAQSEAARGRVRDAFSGAMTAGFATALVGIAEEFDRRPAAAPPAGPAETAAPAEAPVPRTPIGGEASATPTEGRPTREDYAELKARRTEKGLDDDALAAIADDVRVPSGDTLRDRLRAATRGQIVSMIAKVAFMPEPPAAGQEEQWTIDGTVADDVAPAPAEGVMGAQS
jgi:hypothetical protein